MLRLGKIIRLTPRETDRFTNITGFRPMNVKTIDDLDIYIDQCKSYYWGVSEDTRYLHWLIGTDTAHIQTSRFANGRFRHCGLHGIPFAQRSKPLRHVRTEQPVRRGLKQPPALKPGSCRLDAPSMKLRQDVIQLYLQGEVLARV